MNRTYRLKPVLLARMLAELTVFLALALAPLVLFAMGQLQTFHIVFRSMICLASPVGLSLAWAISQIPFQLTLTENGIRSRGVLQKAEIGWSEMLSLALKTKIGWRHYLLTYKSGELRFPSHIAHIDSLVEEVRKHLPSRGRMITGSKQIYKMPVAAHLLLIGQAMLWFGFVILFWFFFDSLRIQKAASADLLLVFGVEIVICVGVIWHFINTLLLPTEIEVLEDSIKISGFVSRKEVQFASITTFMPSKFPFPEGVKLRSGKKTFLVASAIDNFDELLEELNSRLKRIDEKKS